MEDPQKENKGGKSLLVFALVLILCSILSISLAANPSSITVFSSGTLVYGARPLHIEGRNILDVSGRTVVLRGVNYAEFINSPLGDWIRSDGQVVWGQWNAGVAGSNLDAMKSWGVNSVRTLATIEWWANNTSNHHQIIKDWITLAASRGIYIVYGFWRVTGSGSQSSLPYPPYCESNGYITSDTDFVNLWGSVANELKGYPNVLFELWNEPNGNSTAEASWFSVVQRTISAIRLTGSTNIIVVQWGYGLGVNLQNPPPGGWVADLGWIEQYPLNDTAGNILYSIHIYRSSLQDSPVNAYTYGSLKLAFQYTKVDYVINTLQKPLWIGEVGPNQWNTGDLDNEYTFYNNTLLVMNEWSIGYSAWWWWVTGTAWGHIQSGQSNYLPNKAGQILQYGIANATSS